MTTETWQTLIDLPRLSSWMDGEGLGRGPIQNPRALAGGTQNVLLRFERDGKDYVLRRSPESPRGDGNATNRREARVLSALAATEVPHPRLIAACSSEHVLGAAFYLMEPVDGFNATVAAELPVLHASDPRLRNRMGFALVEGALSLGKVDYLKAGLADFGKPEGFIERQVPRWLSLLESYHEYEGWNGRQEIPGIDEIANWLTNNRPAVFSPGLMHGDYHLANVMYCNESPELAAIVDWELATIGDPLLDMGWIMATWPDAEGRTTSEIGVRPWSGFASVEDLVAYYRNRSERDTSNMLWYGVLACYKLGLILEGTYARACAGKASPATGDRLHKSCIKLFKRAHVWLDGIQKF